MPQITKIIPRKTQCKEIANFVTQSAWAYLISINIPNKKFQLNTTYSI